MTFTYKINRKEPMSFGYLPWEAHEKSTFFSLFAPFKTKCNINRAMLCCVVFFSSYALLIMLFFGLWCRFLTSINQSKSIQIFLFYFGSHNQMQIIIAAWDKLRRRKKMEKQSTLYLMISFRAYFVFTRVEFLNKYGAIWLRIYDMLH